jgi:hypothetical protein
MYDITEMIDAGNVMPGSFADETAKEIRIEFERVTLEELRLFLVEGIDAEAPEHAKKLAELDLDISRLTRRIAALGHDSIEALRAKAASALYWHDYDPDGFVREIADADRCAATAADLLFSISEVFCGDYAKTVIEWRAKAAENARANALARARQQLQSAKAA